MPREWTMTVEPYPRLSENRVYRVRINEVRKAPGKPPSIKLTVEHLDDDQLGRVVELLLPATVRPEGPTAFLFRAAGQDVTVDKQVQPLKLKGAIVSVRFGQTADGTLTAVGFEPPEDKKTEPKTASM